MIGGLIKKVKYVKRVLDISELAKRMYKDEVNNRGSVYYSDKLSILM